MVLQVVKYFAHFSCFIMLQQIVFALFARTQTSLGIGQRV